MENYSFQSSNSERNHNSTPPFVPTQPMPWAEEQGEDWSLKDFLSILRRRALVITGVAITVMTTIVVVLILNPKQPEYEGNFQLLVEPVNNDDSRIDVVKDANSTIQSNLDYESQIQVLKSPEIMGAIIKQLQIYYPDINYNSLLDSLTITRLDKTKIIEVRYRNSDQNRIKVVLDKIAKEYLEYSQEKRQTKLRQGIRFVENQLPFAKNRVDGLQKEIQRFRQRYDFVDPDTQVGLVVNQIGSLTEQRQKVNQELAQARANFTIIQGENGKQGVLNSSSSYQQLFAQVRQLDVQIATESVTFLDENPRLQALKEKRESVASLLLQEAQRVFDIKYAEVATQLQTLEVQSRELARTEQVLEQRRKQWPILARQYNELQRKLQIATESLNRFSSTRETLQIQVSQTELGWQLLQAATRPETPINYSDNKRNLIMGLIASILLGIGVALLIEKLDNTYHSANNMKEKTKLPLLGNIPFEKQFQNHQYYTNAHTQKPNNKLPALNNNYLEKQLPIHQDRAFGSKIAEKTHGATVVSEQDYSNYSPKFLEALRVLYTNIQLLSSNRQIRSLVISSAMHGDGKSTIAFHLAQIATAMGQRVLLVDANFRQPVIHNLSGLSNVWGLSNLISTNLPVGEAIRQLPSMNQLSIITAGLTPPDPTKSLSSEKMRRLMADFHNTFDLVIYDTAPLVGLADTTLLASNTDGILMVVKMDKTDASILNRALDNLKLSRLNILGLVGNAQKGNIDN